MKDIGKSQATEEQQYTADLINNNRVYRGWNREGMTMATMVEHIVMAITSI